MTKDNEKLQEQTSEGRSQKKIISDKELTKVTSHMIKCNDQL